MGPKHLLLTALLIGGCAGMRSVPLDDIYAESHPRNRLTLEADYAALLDRYGVRRSDPAFWQHSDDVFAAFERLSSAPAAVGL